MKRLYLLTLSVSLLLSTASFAKRTPAKSNNVVLPLSEQLQKIAPAGFDVVKADRMTSVISFNIETDEAGVVTNRTILEPVYHWAHARLVSEYLLKIKQIPATGEKQSITSKIDFKDFVAQDPKLKNAIEVAGPITLPKFRGSTEYDEFISEVMPLEDRIKRVAVKDSLVRVVIKHNWNGKVRSCKIYSLDESRSRLGENINGGDDWAKYDEDWTYPIVNNKGHIYVGCDIVNLYTTLTDEQYKEALAIRAKTNFDTLETDTYLFAEVMPTFRGGDLAAFRRFVMMNINYPVELAKQNITGMVVMSFFVNTDGTVEIDKVIRSPHELMTQEVKKAILKSNHEWTPASQKGKLVKIKYTIPISFSINKPTNK